jgi:hypothetical protein
MTMFDGLQAWLNSPDPFSEAISKLAEVAARIDWELVGASVSLIAIGLFWLWFLDAGGRQRDEIIKEIKRLHEISYKLDKLDKIIDKLDRIAAVAERQRDDIIKGLKTLDGISYSLDKLDEISHKLEALGLSRSDADLILKLLQGPSGGAGRRPPARRSA